MKNKQRKYVLCLGMVFSLVVWSCSNDDDGSDTSHTAQDIPKVKSIMQKGEWTVSYYFDDKDETSDYAGYIFTFREDGVLVAQNGSDSNSGTWSVTGSDSSDDSSDDVDFNIQFSAPEVLAELTEDWDIKTYGESKIELIDKSGGDGTTDLLTLSKK